MHCAKQQDGRHTPETQNGAEIKGGENGKETEIGRGNCKEWRKDKNERSKRKFNKGF